LPQLYSNSKPGANISLESKGQLRLLIFPCAPQEETVAFHPMRVEIVDDSKSAEHAMSFPPGEDYFGLRENLRGIDRITAARLYLPLRNFLAAVNSADSVFTSATARAQPHSPPPGSSGEENDFSSQTSLVFADSSLNFELDRYAELAARLKGLLERDAGDALQVILRIAACQFTAENRQGYGLRIHLLAKGASAEQAQMRWGLGLARLQQALMFSARALRQQLGA
jgi:hypothetical protein